MGTNRSGGFTLLEALVATAVFGLVIVGVFTVYASSGSVFNRGISSAESQQNARVALDLMSREIRVAGYDPSGVMDSLASPTPLQTAESGRLTFVADIDDNGVLDEVTYRLSGGQLRREVSSWNSGSFTTPTSSVMADGMSSLVFSYFDDDQPTNNPIAAPVPTLQLDDVRRVNIALVTEATTVREQQSFPLFVDVELRN